MAMAEARSAPADAPIESHALPGAQGLMSSSELNDFIAGVASLRGACGVTAAGKRIGRTASGERRAPTGSGAHKNLDDEASETAAAELDQDKEVEALYNDFLAKARTPAADAPPQAGGFHISAPTAAQPGGGQGIPFSGAHSLRAALGWSELLRSTSALRSFPRNSLTTPCVTALALLPLPGDAFWQSTPEVVASRVHSILARGSGGLVSAAEAADAVLSRDAEASRAQAPPPMPPASLRPGAVAAPSTAPEEEVRALREAVEYLQNQVKRLKTQQVTADERCAEGWLQ